MDSPILTGGETIAVSIGAFDSCRNGTCTIMYDTLSEGKHNHNNIMGYGQSCKNLSKDGAKLQYASGSKAMYWEAPSLQWLRRALAVGNVRVRKSQGCPLPLS